MLATCVAAGLVLGSAPAAAGATPRTQPAAVGEPAPRAAAPGAAPAGQERAARTAAPPVAVETEAVATPGVSPAPPSLPTEAVERLIVTLRDDVVSPLSEGAVETSLSSSAGVELDLVRLAGGGARVYTLDAALAPAAAAAVLDELSRHPLVASVEADARATIAGVPSDPMWSQQWHYHGPFGIDLPAARAITLGSDEIVVAVLDTGQLAHPDIAARQIAGYDMISDPATAQDGGGRDPNPTDPGDHGCSPGQTSSWHGLHVAGTIGAITDNGVGVAGVDQHARIQHVRVLGRCGGWLSDIADGIRWAAGLPVPGVPANPTPAKVINLSLGGPGTCGATYQGAIDAATAAGSIVVVAAGNSSAPVAGFRPANCANTITVAASTPTGHRASFSNYGPEIDLAAPGTSVVSTLNAGTTTAGAHTYGAYQGTSMATPHVAGVLSLMAALNPSLTASDALGILQASAKPFPGGSSCAGVCGAGLLDADAALSALSASLAITTPNGGETWHHGASVTVAWTSSGAVGSTARVELLQGPSVVATLATAAPIGPGGTGSVTWTVPATLPTASNYRVRVRPVNQTATATSAADFAVGPPRITVTGPAGTVALGGRVNVTWEREGAVGASSRVDLLRGGALVATLSTSASNATGTFVWTVAGTLAPAADYQLRVTSTTNPGISHTGAEFAVVVPTVSLTSHDSGATVVAGTNQQVTWTLSPASTLPVRIELLRAGVVNRTLSAGTATAADGAGSFRWPVAINQTVGGDYRVRVTLVLNGAVSDTSDAPFPVRLPVLAVTAPDGGETLVGGRPTTVRWTMEGAVAPVRIEVLRDGVVVSTASAAAPTADTGGQFTWTPPVSLPAASTYRLRLTQPTVTSITDTSDADVTLRLATATVTAPAGSATLTIGTKVNVAWTLSDSLATPVRIELLQAGTTRVLSSSAATPTGGNGTFAWTTASNLPPGSYVVRVSATGNAAITGTSGAFTLVLPSLALTSPASGGSILRGTTQPITWTVGPAASMPVRIELVRPDGTAAALVSSSASANSTTGVGTFSWRPATTLTPGTYRIRITATTQPSLTATSTSAFTLV